VGTGNRENQARSREAGHSAVRRAGPAHGRTDVGHRRVSYAWYDASRTQLLREADCIADGTVVKTLPPQEFPAGLSQQLTARARDWWPVPWGECIAWGVTHGAVFGAPAGEYLPSRLVRGRIALVGDAAHVASPMTGAGFQSALLDVEALATSLDGVTAPDAPAGLDRPRVAAQALMARMVAVRRAQSAGVTRSTGPAPCWVVSRTRTAPGTCPASMQVEPPLSLYDDLRHGIAPTSTQVEPPLLL
jgi:hypothetical protein